MTPPDLDRLAALLDRLVEAREWMDTVIHGGAKFAKGSTLVDGEHLLERIDAALMQEPAQVDASAVARYGRHVGDCPRWLLDNATDKALQAARFDALGPLGACSCGFDAALRAARATRTADWG